MDIGEIRRIIEVEPEPFELPDVLDAPAEEQPEIEVPEEVPC